MQLCQTRPDYRQTWDEGRGPGQRPTGPEAAAETVPNTAWLRCPHRGPAIATVRGSLAGCGCSTAEVDVYQCLHFQEPCLKMADPRRTSQIARQVPAYRGKICRRCKLATQALM